MDIISGLPDDLILKILSFVGLKDAIRTSVLSPRWRYVWTSIPHLNFSSKDFSTTDKLSDFVSNVLCRRNNQVQLSFFNLFLRGKNGQDVGRRIINHAFALNVQQLNIKCLFKYSTCFLKRHAYPLSLSGSQTLKHLTFKWVSRNEYVILTSTREFSSLTTLLLKDISLCDGLLSMCPNLESLTLHRCKMNGSKVLRISHTRLHHLTLENGSPDAIYVNVVTPKLKSLTISEYFGGYQISAPELASLLIIGLCPYKFSTDGLHSLEKAQLSFHSLGWTQCCSDVSTIISMLQQFHNVKLLSLSCEIIEFLNSSVEVISRQPFPLASLRSLKILPENKCLFQHLHTKVVMSTEVKNYLLNGSPKATLTEVLQVQCCGGAACAAVDSI